MNLFKINIIPEAKTFINKKGALLSFLMMKILKNKII